MLKNLILRFSDFEWNYYQWHIIQFHEFNKFDGLLDFANQVIDSGVTIKRDVDGESSFGKKVILECIFSRIDISEQAHLLLITNDVSERVNRSVRLVIQCASLKKRSWPKHAFWQRQGTICGSRWLLQYVYLFPQMY